MNAGDLAEGTRALALPVRGVRRGTHGVAQDAGVLFETARLLLVMTRSLLQIARDHVVKMRSLRDNPRSPVVRAPALLFRARAPSVLARVDVEAARPPRVVAPLRIVMSVPLSEVGHFRAEVFPCANRGAFDLSRILALHPDLVVVWTGGTPAAEEARLQGVGLRRAGLKKQRVWPSPSGSSL